jgi:hypothetical protein
VARKSAVVAARGGTARSQGALALAAKSQADWKEF